MSLIATSRGGSPPGIEVRELFAAARMRECQDLQRRAFGISDDAYVLPVSTMVGVARTGGLVLGAYAAGQLVGFAFAFLGRVDGRSVLFSQLTAVDPSQQRRGIGRALKWAQWHRAGAMGLDAVYWTFDPLRRDNAHFNLAILAATSRTYEVDLYGARTDLLSSGLDSDRLFAEWRTATVREALTERWPDAFETIQVACRGETAHVQTLTAQDVPAGIDRAHLEIPARIDALKAADPAMARSWQLVVRSAFRRAFASGFSVVGFANGDRPAYLLRRPA